MSDRAPLARMEAAARGATPGPWWDGRVHDPDGRSREVRANSPDHDPAWEHASEPVGVIDSAAAAAHIAASDPANVAKLAEAYRMLREAVVGAPHGLLCASTGGKFDCNCWKRITLAAADALVDPS